MSFSLLFFDSIGTLRKAGLTGKFAFSNERAEHRWDQDKGGGR